MASTITRFSWTDDTGTPASPVGDGTIINNAQLQLIFDRIDQLFSGAGSYTTLTLGGLLAVDGFGQHAFSSGGTGGGRLLIRNTTAGTGNYAELAVGNDTVANAGRIAHTSTTFTPSGYLRSDATIIDTARVGGISVAATHASGIITLQTSGSQRLHIGSSGFFDFGGGSGNASAPYLFGGTHSPTGSFGLGLTVNLTQNIPVNAEGTALFVAPTLGEAGSGTHAFMSSARFDAPVITAGAAATTVAATIYIGNAPTGGATNAALYVAAGQSLYPSGSASVPSIAFVGDTNTGLMTSAADIMDLVAGGTSFVQVDKGGVFGRLKPTLDLGCSLGETGKTWEAIFAKVITTASAANCFIDSTTGQFFRSTSARRYKSRIRPLRAALRDVLRLQPVTYSERGKPTHGRFPGFIAEDVATVFPELVDWTPDGRPEYVRYDRLSAYLLVACQALERRVRTLEARS